MDGVIELDSNEDSQSRPAKKDAKQSERGRSAQPSERSSDSHRSSQSGERRGYRSDRESSGGYRSDRERSGYRSDRGSSSGGYRSDRERGSSGGYRSDRQGQSSGYRSDRDRGSSGYRSDRDSSQGGRSDRGSGGYRSDRGSSGSYHSDRGSSGGYHSDRGSSGSYHSDRGSSQGAHSDRGSSGTYHSDRRPSSGGYRSDRQPSGRAPQGQRPAGERPARRPASTDEGEDTGDAREGQVDNNTRDDTDEAPAGVRGVKLPKRNDANYTRSYKGSAQKTPARSPNRQNRRGSGNSRHASARQSMLNTHKLAPFKYDMNEVLSRSSMDPTMASSFLATVIAKASRISTRDAKDYVQTFVDEGHLTKDEASDIGRLLDRYSKYR